MKLISRSGPKEAFDLTRFQFPPQPHYTVHQTFCDYARERLIAKGKDCMRAWIGFNNFMKIVPPEQDVTEISTGQVEDFVDMRVGQGMSVTTVSRELVFVKAAINNAHRRNRIKLVPYIELPEGEGKSRIPLSEEQFKVVMSKPMSKRLRRFYWSAYHTGHRSGAIEELKWQRVDFARGIIDFNIPGRPITNKRRCSDFPITPEFRVRLEQWHATREDDYVIGAGCTTYNEAHYVVRTLCGYTDPRLVPRHCMRSMFATEMFERGVDPEIVGHLMSDDPGTLRNNYVKFKQSVLATAAAMRTRAPA